MYARMLEGNLRLEKKPDFPAKMRDEVLPILKKHSGFVDIIALENDIKPERFCILSLWHNKADADRYERDSFPKVNEIIKPFLTMPVVVTAFKVEDTISEHVIAAVAA